MVISFDLDGRILPKTKECLVVKATLLKLRILIQFQQDLYNNAKA